MLITRIAISRVLQVWLHCDVACMHQARRRRQTYPIKRLTATRHQRGPAALHARLAHPRRRLPTCTRGRRDRRGRRGRHGRHGRRSAHQVPLPALASALWPWQACPNSKRHQVRWPQLPMPNCVARPSSVALTRGGAGRRAGAAHAPGAGRAPRSRCGRGAGWWAPCGPPTGLTCGHIAE